MTATFRPEGAKIFEFPRRITAIAERRREERAILARTEGEPVIEWGSSWYHAAAVQQAERSPKA